MDNSTLMLLVLAVTLAGAAFHAWRLGNERRDVALIGGIGGLCGAGAALTAVL